MNLLFVSLLQNHKQHIRLLVLKEPRNGWQICLVFALNPFLSDWFAAKKNNSTEIHLHSHKPLNHGSTRELPTDTDAAVQGEKGDGGYVTKSGTTEKTNMSPQKRGNFQTQTLHGTGAFTYIWWICMVNAGKYTIHWVSGKGKKSSNHNFSSEI